MTLGVKQRDSIVKANGYANIWEGSVRSGKTVSSLFRWFIFINTAPPGALVMVGRTRESIGRNALAEMANPDLFGDLAGQVKYVPGASVARILGRTVYVLGANDAKAEPKIRGLTIVGAYADEITTLPEAFFTQLLMRMISVVGAQLFGTTNPDSPAHWFKKKFLDRALKGWRRFHFTMDDNPILTAEQKARARDQLTGLWRRRFIDGEWVSAEGAIFDMWDESVHVIPWTSIPPLSRMLGIGLDYGTTNPTAALALGMDRAGVLYLVDEWRHDPAVAGVRLSDSQLSAAFRDWTAGKHTMLPVEPRMEATFIDPAAASLKVQLYADNYEGLVDADNNVSYGIRTMASLLSSGRLLVTDRCTGFIGEAPGYSWDDKATARGVDAPVKVADHSLDAGRYVIVSTEPVWRDAAVDRVALAAMAHRYEDERPAELDLMRAPM